MARTKSSAGWLQRHVSDPYVKQAQKDGYRSRSAYKLVELNEKDHLIRPGMRVMDLGSAPGGWSQVAGKLVGEKGRVLATDILPMDGLNNVDFIQGDFHDDAVLARLTERLAGRPVDLVLSDMAPNLSGIQSSDSARIALLVELAVEFARNHLKPQGALVCKVFHGSGYSQLVELFKRQFRVVKALKPKASRDKSAETFLIGIGLKAVGGVAENMNVPG